MSTWPPATHQDVTDKINSIAPVALDYLTPVSGEYMSTQFATSTWQPTGGFALGDAHYLPIMVARSITIDALAIKVNASPAAGAVTRLGLYAPDATGRPGALAVDAGTVDCSSIGLKVASLGTPIVLAPGLYWSVAPQQGTAITGNICANAPLTGGPLAPLHADDGGYTRTIEFPGKGYLFTAGVTGALPANAVPVAVGTNPGSCYAPMVALRAH
jgi:hypothetical protein